MEGNVEDCVGYQCPDSRQGGRKSSWLAAHAETINGLLLQLLDLFINPCRLPQRAIGERIVHRDPLTRGEWRKVKGVGSGFAVEPFGLLAKSEKGVESGLVATFCHAKLT